MKFFELKPDMSILQWTLNRPRDAGGAPLRMAEFGDGLPYAGPQPVHIPVYHHGPVVDFSFGFMAVPVLKRALAAAIAQIAGKDVQLVDALVGRDESPVRILNVTTVIDCLDESRSIVSHDAPRRPDGQPYGKYLSVAKPHIDAEKAEGAKLFRLEHWSVALIASADVVALLERVHASGVKWDPV